MSLFLNSTPVSDRLSELYRDLERALDRGDDMTAHALRQIEGMLLEVVQMERLALWFTSGEHLHVLAAMKSCEAELERIRSFADRVQLNVPPNALVPVYRAQPIQPAKACRGGSDDQQ